jgi:uncharacterized protein
MKTLIGREKEQQILSTALQSEEAELIAVYGRRRVGKTFLIREFYQESIVFEFIGQHDTPLKEQLENFNKKLDIHLDSTFPSIAPQKWSEAFDRLKIYLTPLLKQQKTVIFFDEFPWIDTPKSGFLNAFDYFWNDWASKYSNLKIVICGSAASWIIKKVIQNRGGLHNRVTQRIRLLPFTLRETETFLQNRNIFLDRYQILQLYMAFGGVPHYLKEIKKGQSIAQTINELCFYEGSFLRDEFENLYQSLFTNYEIHLKIVRLLAQKNIGLSRNEIISELQISSGGTVSQMLEELTQSGFVTPYIPFGKTQKDIVYKLSDEYSLFYLKFIEKRKYKGDDIWNQLAESNSYRSWCGFAFESLCHKHTSQLKKAMSIAGIYTEISFWRYKDENYGTQIDLLIDRKDNVINICEMKFSESEFVIDKQYAQNIQKKLSIFREITQTKKTLFFTVVSTYGFKENEHKNRWVAQELTMNDLFIS